MTIKSRAFIAFMGGLLVFSLYGTIRGVGLPEARMEPVSVREGSRTGQARSGRYYHGRRGK